MLASSLMLALATSKTAHAKSFRRYISARPTANQRKPVGKDKRAAGTGKAVSSSQTSTIGRCTTFGLVGSHIGPSSLVLLFDALVDFFAMHRDILGRSDANAHLVAFDAQHRDRYLVADHQGFPHSASQNQHDRTPLPGTIGPETGLRVPLRNGATR